MLRTSNCCASKCCAHRSAAHIKVLRELGELRARGGLAKLLLYGERQLRVAAEGDSAEAAAVAALGEEERTSAAAVLQGVMEDEDEEVPVRMVSQPQPADMS